MARRTTRGPKQVETLTHEEAKRRNIPTAELQSFAEQKEEVEPVEPVRYPRAPAAAEGRDARARRGPRSADRLERRAHPPVAGAGARSLQETGEVEIGDAQLVWRGKDRQDWSDLVVQAPPLYIQEKVHPKAIIDDLDAPLEGERARRRATRRTCSPISTGSPIRRRGPSSTSTTSTGRTA